MDLFIHPPFIYPPLHSWSFFPSSHFRFHRCASRHGAGCGWDKAMAQVLQAVPVVVIGQGCCYQGPCQLQSQGRWPLPCTPCQSQQAVCPGQSVDHLPAHLRSLPQGPGVATQWSLGLSFHHLCCSSEQANLKPPAPPRFPTSPAPCWQLSQLSRQTAQVGSHGLASAEGPWATSSRATGSPVCPPGF